jgi:hypothetical protein
MSDWNFLYEMNGRGFSHEEIAGAATSGAAPFTYKNPKLCEPIQHS